MKKRAKPTATVPGRRITIRLPRDLDDTIRAEAESSPNGEITPIILRYIRQGISPRLDDVAASDLLPGVVMLGAALDKAREVGIGDLKKLKAARQIYALLLEKVIVIKGVDV